METKTVSAIVLTLLLIGMLTLTFDIQPVKASRTIYIRADGSVDPDTAPISSVDNVTYTFTDNIYDSIVVERSNIIVDGNGYTLQGSGSIYGFDLTNMSNVTIQNTNIKNFYDGVCLWMSSNNTVSRNNITNNGGYGVLLYSSSSNTVSGNNITNNYGVYLTWSSNNNTVSGNNITNNTDGVYIDWAWDNTVSGNTITNNTNGIVLSSSSNNILRDNVMANNEYNFGVWGSSLSEFVNDVDTSNTVDGKPVYYLINKRDMAVSLDAGYVALINCTRIIVQELNLTNNWQGVLLAYTTNSTITKTDITNNGNSIHLYRSLNNSISRNNITNNTNYGVYLTWSSNNNTVSGNNITDNSRGIYLYRSSNHNTVSRNNITNNSYGVYLELWSSDNKFYHNNFIDNTFQVDSFNSTNAWDNGYPSGGNYWSDYTDVDLYSGPDQDVPGSDGIWDHPYTIDVDNTDRYPLVEPWTPIPGDVNGDGVVDASDLSDLSEAYGSEPGDGNWNPNCDFNNDYKIEALDLLDLGKNYGK